jgi:hypothetical protein
LTLGQAWKPRESEQPIRIVALHDLFGIDDDAGFAVMRVGRGGIEQDRAEDEGKAQEV